jgi:tRNA-modifying protein YgfZ
MTSAVNPIKGSFGNMSLLSNFSLIKVDGPDARQFLQGQITINADHIETNKLSLAAICNLKGRCIALFFATQIEDAIYLVLSSDTAQTCIDTLKKYAVFSKVEISIADSEYQLVGLSSHGLLPNNDEQYSEHLAVWSDKALAIAFIPQQQFSANENNELEAESVWLSHLTTQGIPWLNAKSSAVFLPHNLNLPKLGAVDFKKGCYTGQEVVARMHYKGKLKSRLQLFSSEQVISAEPTDLIYSTTNKAGEVICCVSHCNQQTQILALTKDSYLDQENFRFASENGPILKLINPTH